MSKTDKKSLAKVLETLIQDTLDALKVETDPLNIGLLHHRLQKYIGLAIEYAKIS